MTTFSRDGPMSSFRQIGTFNTKLYYFWFGLSLWSIVRNRSTFKIWPRNSSIIEYNSKFCIYHYYYVYWLYRCVPQEEKTDNSAPHLPSSQVNARSYKDAQYFSEFDCQFIWLIVILCDVRLAARSCGCTVNEFYHKSSSLKAWNLIYS